MHSISTWAQRLQRVFTIDIKIIACIDEPVVIEKILMHLDRKVASTATAHLPPSRARVMATVGR